MLHNHFALVSMPSIERNILHGRTVLISTTLAGIMSDFHLEFEIMFVKTTDKKELCHICFKRWSADVKVKMEIANARSSCFICMSEHPHFSIHFLHGNVVR